MLCRFHPVKSHRPTAADPSRAERGCRDSRCKVCRRSPPNRCSTATRSHPRCAPRSRRPNARPSPSSLKRESRVRVCTVNGRRDNVYTTHDVRIRIASRRLSLGAAASSFFPSARPTSVPGVVWSWEFASGWQWIHARWKCSSSIWDHRRDGTNIESILSRNVFNLARKSASTVKSACVHVCACVNERMTEWGPSDRCIIDNVYALLSFCLVSSIHASRSHPLSPYRIWLARTLRESDVPRHLTKIIFRLSRRQFWRNILLAPAISIKFRRSPRIKLALCFYSQSTTHVVPSDARRQPFCISRQIPFSDETFTHSNPMYAWKPFRDAYRIIPKSITIDSSFKANYTIMRVKNRIAGALDAINFITPIFTRSTITVSVERFLRSFLWFSVFNEIILKRIYIRLDVKHWIS